MDRQLGNTLFTSLMANSVLLLLIAISVSGEKVYGNRANVSAECDQTHLHTTFKFQRIFKGAIFITDFYFDEICRVMYRLSNESEYNISFPMNLCEFDIIESGSKTFSRTTIRVQQHHMIRSIFDKSFIISCEIPPVENNTAAGIVVRVRERDTFVIADEIPPFRTRFDLKSGLSLFGSVGEPIESNLYFTISIRDRGEHKDMIIQNCYAHDTSLLNNRTNLFHLSNFYGCSDPSSILGDFSVSNETNDGSNLMAYALTKNFTLLSKRRIFFTCAITLCESACPTVCNGSEPLTPIMWSDVITKKIIRKRSNATLSKTQNMGNDGQRILKKRSLDGMSRFFNWESLNDTIESQIRIITTLSNNDSNFETNAADIVNATMQNGIEILTLDAFQNIKASRVLSREMEYLNVTDWSMEWSTPRFRIVCLLGCIVFTAVIVFGCHWEDFLRNPRRIISSFYRRLR